MENGPERAEFWQTFILEKAGYPSPSRLRQHFENAEFTDFCNCGCNSFGLRVATDRSVALLLPTSTEERGRIAIHEADFRLADGKTLEIIIFVDRNGFLDFVEVDCCANSYPIPAEVEVAEPPFHTRSSSDLLV
jgi:hypothetical protein